MNTTEFLDWIAAHWQEVAICVLFVLGGAMTAWGLISSVRSLRRSVKVAADRPSRSDQIMQARERVTAVSKEGFQARIARAQEDGDSEAVAALGKAAQARKEQIHARYQCLASQEGLLLNTYANVRLQWHNESHWLLRESARNEWASAWWLGVGILLETIASVWAVVLTLGA